MRPRSTVRQKHDVDAVVRESAAYVVVEKFAAGRVAEELGAAAETRGV
jgi:hypothetical protein